MKKLALAFAAVAAMVFGSAGMASAAYPPLDPAVTSSPAAGGPGFTVSVTADECAVGETVTFVLVDSTDTVTCGSPEAAAVTAGTAVGSVTAPRTPGTYTGTVTGSVSGALGTFVVTVQGVVTPPNPGGGLPATGSDGIGTTTMMAGGLLAVGLGLFGVATIRRRQTTAA